MSIPRFSLADSRWPQCLPDLKKRKAFEVTATGVAYCLLGLIPERTTVAELYSDRLLAIWKTLRSYAVDIAREIEFPADRILNDCSVVAPTYEPLLDIYFQKPVLDSLRKLDDMSKWLEMFKPGGVWKDIYFQQDDVIHLVVRELSTMSLVVEYLEFLGCKASRIDYFSVKGSKEYEWLEERGLVAGDLPGKYNVMRRDSPIILSVNHDTNSRIRYPITVAEISLILCVYMKYRESGVSE